MKRMHSCLGRQLRVPAGPAATLLPGARQGSSRWIRAMASLKDGQEPDHQKGHEPMPMSMFTPYHQLPPEGKVLHPADTSCDPATHKCKTPVYVYEAKCVSCSGTGFVKSRSRGRRSSLCTCLLCHGLGYVRHTTTRFVIANDDPRSDGVYTMNRPPSDKDAARSQRKPEIQ